MNTRMAGNNTLWLGAALAAIAIFLLSTHYRQPATSRMVSLSDSQVVITAPLQIVMYAGDRFLAADIEAIRVVAIGPSEERALADYRIRAHRVVAQLNPCHEDNLYISNAMLSWGGQVDVGNEILERTTECRYWDEIPPFFLGFNRYFFFRDLDGAREAIDIAAARSEQNRASLQKMSIVIAAQKLNDDKMAADYLRVQRDQATDPRLAKMLDDRLKRLEGLLILRDAQKRFEQQYKRKLTMPNELLTSKILDRVPIDPLRLGYEFRNGEFVLKQLRFDGMEKK